MAIKVSGVTVVDDSKNLSNIVNASLTGTISIGSSPSTGTAGQLLTSNGTSAPTWTTVASSLIPTAIKTAAYTAVTNDLVRCNSTAGVFTVTLPASPADGAMIGVMDVNGTFGTYAVTVAPNTGKTIEGDATSLVLDVTNAYVELVYNSSTTNWRLQETPVGILGDVTTTGTQTLTNKTITGTKETKVAMAANNVDLSAGNYFSKTISGATTLTVSNVPTTGTAISFILDLTNGGSATITWFTGVKWASGTAPTLTASGRDVLAFFTHDGGTTWSGFVLGKALA